MTNTNKCISKIQVIIKSSYAQTFSLKKKERNILYSKDKRPRSDVVVHDCILALGRVVRAEKKNKEFKATLGSKFRGSLDYTILSQKAFLYSKPGLTAQKVCPYVLGSF